MVLWEMNSCYKPVKGLGNSQLREASIFENDRIEI
jgi:hypothetical protein